MELLNNLRWAIAHAEPPDLDRALNLANAAHQAAPNHPDVLETRGQILAKLGRWKEAITDLDKALPAMPNRARVHDTLAPAYENLGVKELADEHRRRARAFYSSHCGDCINATRSVSEGLFLGFPRLRFGF